jgi:transposase InsO family protein
MAFTIDTLADGRAFRPLNIVDDFTRECRAIGVDRTLPGLRVTRVLDRLRAPSVSPGRIVVDNRWRTRKWKASAGNSRDECSNEYWFISVGGKAAIET